MPASERLRPGVEPEAIRLNGGGARRVREKPSDGVPNRERRMIEAIRRFSLGESTGVRESAGNSRFQHSEVVTLTSTPLDCPGGETALISVHRDCERLRLAARFRFSCHGSLAGRAGVHTESDPEQNK